MQAAVCRGHSINGNPDSGAPEERRRLPLAPDFGVGAIHCNRTGIGSTKPASGVHEVPREETMSCFEVNGPILSRQVLEANQMNSWLSLRRKLPTCQLAVALSALFHLFIMAVMLLPNPARADVPSVKLQSGALVSPTNWWSNYPNSSSTTHTVGVAAPTSTAPEIVALANALSANGSYTASGYVTAVFEYVRNNIAVEYRFGLGKGALGALIDQSGTPLDQDALIVALLKYGNSQWSYNLTVNYQAGTVSLTATQFLAWTGFTNAQAGCQFLADGGIPASVNNASSCAFSVGTAISSVVIGHVWVVVNAQIYDPGLKIHIVKAGVDLASALGCGTSAAPTCGSTVVNNYVPAPVSSGIAGVNQIQNVNQGGLESALTGYAIHLQQYIQGQNIANRATSNPNMQVEDLIGGLTIDWSQPVSAGTPLATSAYSTNAAAWSDVPDQLRTTLTVQFAGFTQLVYADETSGRRLRIFNEAINGTANSATLISTLYLEYRPLASNYPSGAPGQTGTLVPLALTTTHPYAPSAAYPSETLNFNELTIENGCGPLPVSPAGSCSTTVWYVNVITIVQGWGDSTESGVAHASALQQRDETDMPIENPTDPRHTWQTYRAAGGHVSAQCINAATPQTIPSGKSGCFETHQPTLAASWLAQASRAARMAAGVNSTAIQMQYSLGTVSSGLAYGGTNVVNIQSSLSANSLNAVGSDRTSAFFEVAAVFSRLEGSVLEQQSSIWEGGSAVSMMTKSNQNHVVFYDLPNLAAVNNAINSGNLNTYSIYGKSELQTFASANFDIIVPQNSAAGTFGSETYGYTGLAAFGLNGDRMTYLTGVFGGDKGAAGTSDPVDMVSQQTTIRNYATKSRKGYVVDMNTGGLTLTPPPDLVTGVGPFPYSLSLQRFYDSKTISFACGPNLVLGAPECMRSENEISGLPLGWTHNFAITARLTNDAFAGFGRDSALDASAAIAAFYTARTMNTGARTFQSNLGTIFTINWLGENLVANVVAVRRPPAKTAFVRLPDGSFNPSPGNFEKLTQSGSRSYDGLGYWNNNALAFSLVDKEGSTLSFTYGAATDPSGSKVQTLYLPSTWTFASGIQISFGYGSNVVFQNGNDKSPCLASVSNNLGRSLNFKNACLASTSIPATVLPQTITDETGSRTLTFQLLPSSLMFGLDTGVTGLQVTAPDGNSTSEFDYVPFPTVHINRSYFNLLDWITPLEKSAGAAPYLTVGYDSLFRVSATTDDATPTPFTTHYYIAGLYGFENQKRSEFVDPLSATTTKYFDRWGAELQNIDPLGFATTRIYDTFRRLIQVIRPAGNGESYTYDVRHNRLSTISNPVVGSGATAATASVSYMEGPMVTSCVNRASCNHPYQEVDANGNAMTYSWNANGTVASITSPAISDATPANGTAQTFYCYTPYNGVSLLSGRVQTVDGTRTRVTSYAYNSSNKYVLSSTIVDPTASLTTACGATTKSTGLNLTTGFTFDGVGNVSTITNPSTYVTNYYFDPLQRLTRVDAPAALVNGTSIRPITRYTYDLDGERLTTRHSIVASPSDPTPTADNPTLTASDWQTETRTYWPTGDLQSVQDANGHLTQYSYDPDGRVTLVTDPDSRGTGMVYDLAGQTTCVFKAWNSTTPPAASNCSSWTPASYTSSTSPLRYAVYTYTGNGKQQTVIDADANVTQYVYDGLDRLGLTLFPDPDNGSLCTPQGAGTPTCTGRQTYELYGYDPNGNRTSLRTRKGDVIASTYNSINLVATKTVPSLPQVTYAYWLTGDPQAVTYAGSHSTTYDYDGAGRKSYESNDGRTVLYGYDPAGNRSSTQWPDSYLVSYTYDALNRMSDVRETNTSGPLLAHYDYDILGRRQKVTYAGNTSNYTSYGYDAASNLNALTNQMAATALSFGYGRNNSNQITALNVSDSFYLPEPTVYTNNGYAVNKLNEYIATGAITGTDANGNPIIKGARGKFIPIPFDDLSIVIPSVPYGKSPTDSTNDPGGNTIVNDLNGNMRRWTGPDGARNAYTYDAENRLRTATTGSHSVTYDYDPLGRRVSKTVDGTITGYLLDGDEEIAEYNVATTGVWPAASARRYITGPAIDDRIAVIDTPTAIKNYYHVNHQGSVMATTDLSGNVVQRLSYDEYGNLSAGSTTTGQVFRYTGRRYDPETGLYYYRARYYAPQIGRFLQTDPVGYKDDFDLYTYVGNDPLDKTDPTGNQIAEGALVAGCAAAPEVCAVVAVVGVLAGGAAVEHAVQNSSNQDSGEKKQDSNSNSGDGGNGNKNGPGKEPPPPATGNKPESKTPEGAGRSGAFRKAKEDNGIPRSQQPDKTKGNTDRGGRDTPGRQYDFTRPDGSKTTIRDDAAGHQYPDDPSQDRGPHFNDENGNHYDYPPPP